MAFSARTDLAIESAALLERKPNEKIDGVNVESYSKDRVRVTKVEISNEKGSKIIGKPIGNYVTMECEDLHKNDEIVKIVEKIFSDELKDITKLSQKSMVLAVGLGNRFVTPDALGPKVTDKLCVTRHLTDEIKKEVSDGRNSLCAISPGVLGITGIETGEIIRGIAEKIKPDLIIATDALASRSISRINTTIQLADTGITPGSGIGNVRNGLNSETLGVPVIAIGVPTVVDAATIANDCFELMINESETFKESEENIFFDEEKRYSLIKAALSPYVGSLIVTPKDVDAVIDTMSQIIANGINRTVLGEKFFAS